MFRRLFCFLTIVCISTHVFAQLPKDVEDLVRRNRKLRSENETTANTSKKEMPLDLDIFAPETKKQKALETTADRDSRFDAVADQKLKKQILDRLIGLTSDSQVDPVEYKQALDQLVQFIEKQPMTKPRTTIPATPLKTPRSQNLPLQPTLSPEIPDAEADGEGTDEFAAQLSITAKKPIAIHDSPAKRQAFAGHSQRVSIRRTTKNNSSSIEPEQIAAWLDTLADSLKERAQSIRNEQ